MIEEKLQKAAEALPENTGVFSAVENRIAELTRQLGRAARTTLSDLADLEE